MKPAILLLVLIAPLAAQTQPAPPASYPAYVLAFGGGFSEASDPHYAMTGTFALAIGDGTYSLTSLDMSSKFDPATQKRVTFSSLRSGIERVVARAGPFTLAAHLDGGLSLGNGAAVGLVSGGGTITWDLPRHPELFLYGTYRALRSPQIDVTSGAVQSAVSIGIGLKLYKTP